MFCFTHIYFWVSLHCLKTRKKRNDNEPNFVEHTRGGEYVHFRIFFFSSENVTQVHHCAKLAENRNASILGREYFLSELYTLYSTCIMYNE